MLDHKTNKTSSYEYALTLIACVARNHGDQDMHEEIAWLADVALTDGDAAFIAEISRDG